MTREEYTKICSMCTNRSFNPKLGVICGITNEPANFEGNCKDFEEDDVAVKHEVLKEENDKSVNKKSINNGRIALFVIGGFYLIVGFYEAYVILGAHILFGIIDWILAGVFIGLGILSYRKASLSLILGLGFYVLIILLLFAIEPMSLVSGIIWKAIIIAWLVYGISSARAEERKERNEQKTQNGDILDQL